MRRELRGDRGRRRPAGAAAAGVLSAPSKPAERWPRRRTLSTPDRSRALLVGTRPPRAGAHEARPPAAPVPRQVHPAAGRGPARAPRPARPRARSVCRLGDDARAGAGVGLRRLRRGRRGLQLPADAREDGRVQPVRARVASCGTRSGGSRRSTASVRRHGSSLRPRLVRASGGRRAALLPRASSRTTSMRTSCGSCSRARPARPGARPTSTSTSRGRRSASRTGATSTSANAVPSARRGAFLRRYTLDTLARVRSSRACARVGGAPGDARRCAGAGLRRSLRRRRHVAAVSGADRLPRAAPLRVRVARARGPGRSSSGAAGGEPGGSRCVRRGRRCRARERPAAPAARARRW